MQSLALRLAQAVEPLIGRHLDTMLPSAAYGGDVVSLWIQPLADGRIQVDAVHPHDGYRVLFKERFTQAAPAIAYWHAAHLELFGFEPE